MTRPEPDRHTRQEENHSRAAEARRELDRLLAVACHPEFTGRVGIEISVQRGRLLRLRASLDQYR